MADFLPVYQGDAALGGDGGGVYDSKNFETAQKAFDNSFTANIQGQQDRLKLLGDTQKTIALLDNEFNVKLWQQKVADRDNMYAQYLKGNAQVDNYLPGDSDALKGARAKYDDAYKEWAKNINNRDAAKKYKQATDELNDVAARLAVRYKSKQEQEKEAASKLLPDEKNGLLKNINSWENAKDKDGKPALPSIYQPFQKYDADKFNKQAVITTTKIPTKDGLYNIPFSTFNYKQTRAKVDDMQKELGVENVANEFQHKYFDELTPDQQYKQIQAINEAISDHNINHPDDQVQPISFGNVAGKVKLLDNPADYAAKYLLAQNPDKKGQPEENKFGLDIKKQAETERHNKMGEAIDWAKLDIDKKKANAQIKLWDSKTAGTKDGKSAALNYATNLYGQLKELADPQTGVIAPDKLRQLTAEQLKYLGFYTEGKSETTKDGAKTTKTGLVPLTFGENDLIELSDGKIKIMKGATYDPKIRAWIGKWDNSRTTTIQNIATNRVNEENKLAGGKEINGYLAIDGLGGDGQEGSTQPEKKVIRARMPDGSEATSTDGINWVDKDGKPIEE